MFTLAWYRLGLARALAQSMGHEGDNYASLTRAMQHRERLSAHDKLLLTGWYAHFHGRSDVAERVARQVIGGDPANAEAWHLLGFTRMWYAWQRGRSYADARAAHERALAIDPRFPDAVFHGSWAAILDERYAYADSLFRAAPTSLIAGPWAQVTRGLFVFRHGDRQAQEAYARTLETVDDQSLLAIGWILASHSDSLTVARRWLSRFERTAEHSDWGRASGGIFLAHLEAARGRWSEARALFQRAARYDRATALSSYAWLAAMPFFERPMNELLAIRDSVRDWHVRPLSRDSGRVHPQTLPEVLSIPVELRPWVRDYLLGLLSVRLGDRAEAERHAVRLERAVDPVDRIGLRRDLALEIRAALALGDGRPENALKLLERASMSVEHADQVWHSPYYSREFVYRAPAFLRQAEIHERRSMIDHALSRYQRFIVRWEQADPEYQALVQRATDRMRALAIATH
jgi:tetratricopeptide (TPR) repeat protein